MSLFHRKYYLKDTFLVKRINNDGNFTFLEYEIDAVSFVCVIYKRSQNCLQKKTKISIPKFVWTQKLNTCEKLIHFVSNDQNSNTTYSSYSIFYILQHFTFQLTEIF